MATVMQRPARRKLNATAVPAPGDAALVWPAAGEGDTKPDGSPNRWATADVLTWTTACGRYRVYRIDSMSRERVHFGACYKDVNGTWMSCEDERKDGWHPRYYRWLELAMEAAERKHAVRTNSDAPPQSNRAAVCAALGELARARQNESGVADAPAAPTITPTGQRRRDVRLTKSEAVGFMVGMGFPTADRWPPQKLADKINIVSEWKDAGTDPPAGAAADRLAEIENCLAEGGRVEVTDDGGAAPPVQTTIPKKTKHKENGTMATATATKRSGKKVKVGRATVTAAKTRPDGDAGKTPRTGVVFGKYSVAAVGRWMGKEGWDYEQAAAAFARLKIDVKETSLRTYVSDGKGGKYGAPAPLTREEAKQLS